jgi:hypothetical protein
VLVALLPAPSGGGMLVAGFATVYRFYAWPAGSRLRLSQLLVFPPLQRRGVAGALLAGVRALAISRDATDYAVEDPTDELQRLREIADVRAARALPEVAAAAAAAVAAATAAPDAPSRRAALELSPAITEALRVALRVCKPQARLVWEALLFLAARVRCCVRCARAACLRPTLRRLLTLRLDAPARRTRARTQRGQQRLRSARRLRDASRALPATHLKRCGMHARARSACHA